jgi:hypothetical protein
MKILTYSKTKSHFWFRLFGIGFSIRDITVWKMLFSERNGYTKYIKIGKWLVTYLPRITSKMLRELYGEPTYLYGWEIYQCKEWDKCL